MGNMLLRLCDCIATVCYQRLHKKLLSAVLVARLAFDLWATCCSGSAIASQPSAIRGCTKSFCLQFWSQDWPSIYGQHAAPALRLYRNRLLSEAAQKASVCSSGRKIGLRSMGNMLLRLCDCIATVC